MCSSKFPEEILLKSHIMSHGIPAPTISSVNRYKSQLQDQKPVIDSPSVLHTEPLPNDGSAGKSRPVMAKKEPADSSGLISLQIPLQIKTPDVVTTQPGTPIAITSTDSNGQNFIQLIPVQLLPAMSKEEGGIILT